MYGTVHYSLQPIDLSAMSKSVASKNTPPTPTHKVIDLQASYLADYGNSWSKSVVPHIWRSKVRKVEQTKAGVALYADIVYVQDPTPMPTIKERKSGTEIPDFVNFEVTTQKSCELFFQGPEMELMFPISVQEGKKYGGHFCAATFKLDEDRGDVELFNVLKTNIGSLFPKAANLANGAASVPDIFKMRETEKDNPESNIPAITFRVDYDKETHEILMDVGSMCPHFKVSPGESIHSVPGGARCVPVFTVSIVKNDKGPNISLNCVRILVVDATGANGGGRGKRKYVPDFVNIDYVPPAMEDKDDAQEPSPSGSEERDATTSAADRDTDGGKVFSFKTESGEETVSAPSTCTAGVIAEANSTSFVCGTTASENSSTKKLKTK